MAAERRRRAAYRKRHQNRTGITLVSVVVVIILAVVGFQSISLKQQKAEYEKKEQYYLDLIAEEEARSVQIAEFEKYTHTTKYAEEVAKKFGLVKDGEIVFVAED